MQDRTARIELRVYDGMGESLVSVLLISESYYEADQRTENKISMRGYHIEKRIYIHALHLLRTDHVSPDELVDVVEVPGFRDSAVVIAVRQLLPHHDLGLAQTEELLHVAWSIVSSVCVPGVSEGASLRYDLILQPTQEEYGDLCDLGNHLLTTPVLVTEGRQPLRHRHRIWDHLGDAEKRVLQN